MNDLIFQPDDPTWVVTKGLKYLTNQIAPGRMQA